MTKDAKLKLFLGLGAIGIVYLLIRDLKNAQKNYKASNDANFSNLTDTRPKDCNIFHENPRIVREQMELCASMGKVYGGRCYGCISNTPIKSKL